MVPSFRELVISCFDLKKHRAWYHVSTSNIKLSNIKLSKHQDVQFKPFPQTSAYQDISHSCGYLSALASIVIGILQSGGKYNM